MRQKQIRLDSSTKIALDLLDLKPGATPKQLKSAYRKMAVKTHPDKAGGSSEKFIKIKCCYDYLMLFGTTLMIPAQKPVPRPQSYSHDEDLAERIRRYSQEASFAVDAFRQRGQSTTATEAAMRQAAAQQARNVASAKVGGGNGKGFFKLWSAVQEQYGVRSSGPFDVNFTDPT